MSILRTTAGSALLAGVIVTGGPATAVAATAHTSAQPTTAIVASSTAETQRAWPVYNRGDRGPNVRTIQFMLRDFSSATRFLAADGIYGPNTARAVRLYQESRDLAVDGIVGPRTWAKLAHEYVVRRGGRGPDVRAVQVQLRKNGYPVAIDGVFGPRTERAVRAAERRFGLTVNGVVGASTWRALVTHH